MRAKHLGPAVMKPGPLGRTVSRALAAVATTVVALVGCFLIVIAMAGIGT